MIAGVTLGPTRTTIKSLYDLSILSPGAFGPSIEEKMAKGVHNGFLPPHGKTLLTVLSVFFKTLNGFERNTQQTPCGLRLSPSRLPL